MNDDLIRDVYERMGRMEAKLDDVRAIREKTDEALSTARKAEQATYNNSKDIEGLTATIKWGFGLIASAIVPIVIFILGQVVK